MASVLYAYGRAELHYHANVYFTGKGKSMNLAPFSFTNMINYDPPLFTVGFTGCGIETAKDTLKNIVETGECRHTSSRISSVGKLALIENIQVF